MLVTAVLQNKSIVISRYFHAANEGLVVNQLEKHEKQGNNSARLDANERLLHSIFVLSKLAN